MAPADIKVDPAKIPSVDVYLLCSTFLQAAKRFYEDPENVRKYEEWLKTQEED